MYIKRDKVRIKVIPHSRLQSLRSFWPAAGIESSGSNHFEITKEITAFCPSGLTQSSSMAHARDGCSQSTRFLPQARRIVGSGDENGNSLVLQRIPTAHDFCVISACTWARARAKCKRFPSN